MKDYKLVIFDLDGTLADTSEGIYNAHRYTAEQMGIELYENSLVGVIGGELLSIYQTRFGLSAEKAREAVDIYRAWYQETGIFQAELYSGMDALLAALKSQGMKLAVATLKREDFAVKLLKSLGVAQYFDVIYGMDHADTLNKSMLIEKCLRVNNGDKNSTVLVGDSLSDLQGARLAEIDFIPVMYGFGFQNKDELPEYKFNVVIEKINDLKKYLIT